MATISTYSAEVQFNNVYYNSEWGKLLLLLWKKSRINWQELGRKIFIFVSPLSFVTILLLLRFAYIAKPFKRNHVYPPVNLSIYWHELVKTIDERKMQINKQLPEFTYNPFIPQKIIGWAPDQLAFENIMRDARESLKPMKLKKFKNCKELKKAILEDHLFCGVCLKNEYPLRDNTSYHYHGDLQNLIGIYPRYMCFHMYFPNNLRFYHDSFIGKTWETHAEFSLENKNRPRNILAVDGGTPGYVREGFVHIQQALNLAYLNHIRLAAKSEQIIPNIYIRRFPERNYIGDDVLEKIDFGFSFMIIFSKLILILDLVTEIVREKKHSRKPYYKVLGIGGYVHFIAALIRSFAVSLANTICAVIVYKVIWMDGLAIMNRCSFLQLLSIFSVYNLTSIAFCLMITSFCTYEDTALLLTSFVWLISYMPFLACVNGFTHVFTDYSNFFVWICHNTVMGFILELILAYEMYFKDQHFIGLYRMLHFKNGTTLNTYIIIMISQGIVYMLIGLYVEGILPHHFEFIRKWYRNRKYKWQNKKREQRKMFGPSVHQPDTFIHEIGDKKVVIVDIKNITKKYGNEYVLRDVSLQLYENEITILVGHNGCGKTTLIQLICGQLFPTSGYITIDSFNVIREQKVACASLGICVQDSVLYDNLSVQDQLRFFSYLKAYDVMSVENDVLNYLYAMNLYDKRDVITKDLPVGIRQELAICCALAGQSRIVLLDEPNAIMDDESRYRSWELILSQKQGRTILITTTYIEMLIALGDRIAVLSQGQLHCAGSPSFLNKIYSSGYRLIVVRKNRDKNTEITEIIRQYLPNIEPASFLGFSTYYIIEERYFDRLKPIISELEANRQRLQIIKICIRQSNLEDIFYQMGTEDPPLENRNKLMRVMRGTIDEELLFLNITERNQHKKAIKQRVRTLLAMKYKLAIYKKLEIIMFFLVPLFFIHMSYFISFFHFHNVEAATLVFGSYKYKYSTTLLHIENATDDNNDSSSIIANYGQIYGETILWMGYNYALVFTNIPIDKYISNKTYYEMFQYKIHTAATFGKNNITTWFNNHHLHLVPLSLNLIHQTIQRAILNEYSNLSIVIKPMRNQPTFLDGQIRNGLSTGTILAVFVTIIYTILLTNAVYRKINERENGIKHMQLLAGVSARMYWIINLAVDSFLLCMITTSVLFVIIMHQFVVLTSYLLYVWLGVMMMLCGMALFAFNYLIASFCKSAAHGYIIVIVISCFSMVTFIHYNQGYEVNIVSSPRHLESIFFIFIPQLLICNAISAIYYVNYFQRICANEHIRTISIYLEQCRALPNCCRNYNYFDLETGLGVDIIMSIIIFSICWGIIILKESKYNNFWKPKISEDFDALLNDHIRRHEIVGDDIGKRDTFNEAIKAQSIEKSNQKFYPLICDRVGKSYGEVIGIERFSLALNNKEIFGIIGTSGSGVTTLYEMIAGRMHRNYGDIFVNGYCSFNDYNRIKNNIGYGQQHLELTPELTVGELLEYLCNLHCYPEENVQDICENLTLALGIVHHYDKSLFMLSCGASRLLSCAIAMLGKRELLVLDCITPDIDVSASKRLWNILLNMNENGTTILLTVRNFAEAENYCDRACLMSFGICYKLASPRTLDVLYEDYHMLQVRFNTILNESKLDPHSRYMYYTSLDKLKKFMREEFTDAQYYRTIGNYMEFIIPINSANLWNLFSTLRYNSYFLNIESYEITRLTYYQTFSDNIRNLIMRHTRRIP